MPAALLEAGLAARRPDKVRSLVSIMSTTGHRFKGQPAAAMYRPLLTPAPTGREEFLDHIERVFTLIGSPGRADVEDLREVAALSFDRDRDPAATPRQLAAILASGNRTRELRGIRAPTLVMHGTKDRLVRPSGGEATARASPGSRLVRIAGMGHDLPRSFWKQIADEIADHAHAADRTAPAHIPA